MTRENSRYLAMKIMVFLHGTTIGEENGVDRPIGNAARKLRAWKAQGTQIMYLTHRRRPEDIEKEKQVLARHGFPLGPIYFREKEEEYSDVAERVLPDVIVEDDCASIGGAKEMTYPHTKREIRKHIRSIVVKKGGGIDHLPDDITELSEFVTHTESTKRYTS